MIKSVFCLNTTDKTRVYDIPNCILSTLQNVFRSRQGGSRCAGCRKAAAYVYLYWVPGHRGIPRNEIANKIAKSAIRLAIVPVKEIRKSLKTIYSEISKRADRRIMSCRIANKKDRRR